MKLTVVTSFNEDGYHKYGKHFIESFNEFWPKSVQLRAYYHDFKLPEDAPSGPNVKYLDLLGLCPFIYEFRQRFPKATGQKPDGYNYRFDAQKFIHKMYAIFDTAQKTEEGYEIWLDGDTFTKKKITRQFLEKLLVGSPPIVHLGRKAINYSETSFLAFNMKSPQAIEFLADFKQLYETGELFGYSEWHDGYAFERLLNLYKGHGIKPKNLTPECADLNAFGVSPLSPFMEHLKGDIKDGGQAPAQAQLPGPRPIKIIPKNAVADETILQNVDANRKLITRWIKKCSAHQREAIVISGGPSIQTELETIRDVLDSAYRPVVFCVKHSHNFCLENFLTPKFCVMLDPRSFEGMSTHNQKRSELIKNPSNKMLYLTASMVSPEVTKYLISKGADPLGWHAWTNTVMGLKLPEDQFFVTGGTCAAVRSIALAHTMGFRKFHLFGYDSSWPNEPDQSEKDEQGRPKYLKASGRGPGGTERWTTGELLSQAQDIQELLKTVEDKDLTLKLYGEGLVQDIAKNFKFEKKEEYDNWYTGLISKRLPA